jgi:hypothetical protein
MLAARRRSRALHAGDLQFLPARGELMAFQRTSPAGEDRRVVVINFGSEPATFDLGGSWLIEVSSAGPAGEGGPFTGRLAGDQALILRPA